MSLVYNRQVVVVAVAIVLLLLLKFLHLPMWYLCIDRTQSYTLVSIPWSVPMKESSIKEAQNSKPFSKSTLWHWAWASGGLRGPPCTPINQLSLLDYAFGRVWVSYFKSVLDSICSVGSLLLWKRTNVSVLKAQNQTNEHMQWMKIIDQLRYLVHVAAHYFVASFPQANLYTYILIWYLTS